MKNGNLAPRPLTRELFNALTALELARRTGARAQEHSALEALGYAQNGILTPQGLAALEPYRVRRAVFIAAGFGSRMAPVTLRTPKPLVRVHHLRWYLAAN